MRVIWLEPSLRLFFIVFQYALLYPTGDVCVVLTNESTSFSLSFSPISRRRHDHVRSLKYLQVRYYSIYSVNVAITLFWVQFLACALFAALIHHSANNAPESITNPKLCKLRGEEQRQEN